MANTDIFCMIPPQPELLEKIRKTKRMLKSGADLGQLHGKDMLDFRMFTQIISRPLRTRAHTLVSPTREFAPTTGTVRALVLLVDFSDNLANEQAKHFEEMLFSRGTYTTGSLRDFYQENSYGMLDVRGDVRGWYRAPKPYSYYTNGEHGFGSYPQNVQKLVEDTVHLAAADVNFADYDLDGDGYVDALFVVHAGSGAEATGDLNQIWSHRWSVSPVLINGVRIRDYTMEPEDGRIGVFCHELGHNFGLPDLYDTDYDSHGIGDWCLMAGGTWNNGGLTPGHMSSWCKDKMGWLTSRVIHDAERTVSIASSATSPDVIKLPVGDIASKEYFLVENRQKSGFNQYIPGEGLLIWHVDENQINNNDQGHYLVALEQADGKRELESGADRGDSGDPFPGTAANRQFSHDTNPNSVGYDGSSSQVSVTHISDPGETMSVTVRVGETPARHALGDRPTKDIYSVSSKMADKLAGVGVNTIAQLAVIDVLAFSGTLGLNALTLFTYKARAHLVTNFDIDIRPFTAIHEMKLADILAETSTNLVNQTGQSNSALEQLKLELAQLGAAIDGSIFKSLALIDVG